MKLVKEMLIIHEQKEIFEFLEKEFCENFHLSKEGFEIYDQIQDHLQKETQEGAITRHLEVSRFTILNNFNPTYGLFHYTNSDC